MKILEKFSGIFLIAGLGLLIFGMITLGFAPAMMVQKVYPGMGMPQDIPQNFHEYYSNLDDYHNALRRGRDLYIREACWHCHSQYVRPISNETLQYGPVSVASEYNNELNLPQLFGTRRVGPDLSREAGKRTNDWHFAHLYKPRSVEPESVMPDYPWYFEVKDGLPVPTADGVAIVAYLQWLGKEFESTHNSELYKGRYTQAPRE